MKKNSKSYTIPDIRMTRPVMIHNKTLKKTITIQRIETFSIGDCKISFPTPNNVSLFASIAKKEKQQAKNIFSSLITKDIKNKKELKISDKDTPRLFNYFEHIQSSVIAIYTALEAFANIAIPAEFTHTFKNSKGITETWDKKAIERWYKTSDKLCELLPKILESDSPKTMPNWSRFKELENIRNDIIHQKTVPNDQDKKIDSTFLKKLLTSEIFNIIDSGFELISFFCQKDTSHAFFPIGFSETLLKPLEVDDFLEVIRPLDSIES